jgi:pimeloyl-ACP methyl ester carboxylesterase
MKAHRLLLFGILAMAVRAAADPPAEPTGFLSNVTFMDYSPYSRGAELLRRSFSPLLVLRGQREAARSGPALREQDIDLRQEKFALYVPDQAPPNGYRLLVYVSPFQEATVPRHWKSTLDRHGMIFVIAANAGNGTSTLERREPLALLAAQNVINRYKVDPQQVYIGGLSGGSKVALHAALAYPDLFHGALLNAGADPIGEKNIVPPADLFRQFQESSRLIDLTGERDDYNLITDADSQRSMRDWCMFNIDRKVIPYIGHEPADSASIDAALDLLVKPRPVDQEEIDACRAKIDAEMAAQFRQVDDMLAAGKTDEARTALDKIDARNGGLATKGALELAEKLGEPRSPTSMDTKSTLRP